MIPNKQLIILKRVLCLVFGYDVVIVSDLFSRYDKLATLWFREEGKRQAVKRLKGLCTLCVSKRLENEYLKQEDWISVSERGYPKSVNFLVKFLTGSPREMRLAFTVLRLYTLVLLPPSFEISTIVEPGNGTMYYSQRRIQDCYRIFKKTYRIPQFKDNPRFKWYVSSKAGPNGKPAYTKWIEDAFALHSDVTVKQCVRFLWDYLG